MASRSHEGYQLVDLERDLAFRELANGTQHHTTRPHEIGPVEHPRVELVGEAMHEVEPGWLDVRIRSAVVDRARNVSGEGRNVEPEGLAGDEWLREQIPDECRNERYIGHRTGGERERVALMVRHASHELHEKREPFAFHVSRALRNLCAAAARNVEIRQRVEGGE